MMRACLHVTVFLFLSQAVLAEEKLSAEAAIQSWLAAQREHPVETVAFDRTHLDRVFWTQMSYRGQVTFAGENSGKAAFIPWPDDEKLPLVRSGYRRGTATPTYRYSWDHAKITTHEFDGTMRRVFPRHFKILWEAPRDLVDDAIPPLFPGPGRESRIASYDRAITRHTENAVWLSADPKIVGHSQGAHQHWEFVLEYPSWRTLWIRELDALKTQEVITRIEATATAMGAE